MSRTAEPPDVSEPVRIPTDPDVPRAEGPTAQSPVQSAALTVIAVCAVIALLRYMQEVLIPFVLAGLTFYALDPAVDWLQRRRIPRAIGAAILLATLVGAVSAAGYALRDNFVAVANDLPQAVDRLRATLRPAPNQPPGTMEKLQRAASELDQVAAEAAGTEAGKAAAASGVVRVQIEEPGVQLSSYLRWGPAHALSFASGLILILFLSYFLLLTDDLFKRKLVEVIGSTITEKKITVQVLNQIAMQIQAYLKVQIFTSVVVGVTTWLALYWIGLENSAVWGLSAGLLNSIPYFGPLLVTAGLTAIAYVQFGTIGMALTVAFTALVITTIEGWVLTPLLMSRVAQINTVSIFAALLFWSWMWGVWGLLLAVPITMAIKAVCDRVEGLQPVGTLLGE
jgi:predicted PurR-regulated permease PerM